MNTAADYLDLLMDAATVAVWMIALARLTRLLTVDRITDFLREWAWKISKSEDGLVFYLSTCPWCVSLWLGLITAPFLMMTIDLSMWWTPIFALVGSWFVGVSAENFEGGHDEIEIVESDDK
jgi:hypothetical protein